MDANAHLDLIQKSTDNQRKANQAVVDSQLDAGDRILARKAADTVQQIAQVIALTDPTP